MTSPQLVIAWLVLGHLLADFVLQTDAIAVGKFGDGQAAWRALGMHVLIVAIVDAPLVVVFGLPGVAFVAVTAATHLVIDRTKIVLTRRSVATRDPEAETADADEGPPLDRTWSPVPAALFAADQAVHLGVLLAAWAVLLSAATPIGAWQSLVDALLRLADPAAFHRTVIAGVVLASLVIVNVRAASLLVVTLVRAPRPAAGEQAQPGGIASPARVGATIGILERLLICSLVLAGAVSAVGLVIAAKTLARFKQLDDREFAEYYLLGTLASVTIAVASSLLAQEALR